jgi:hypothetical protein
VATFKKTIVRRSLTGLAANLLLAVFCLHLQGAEPSASTSWKMGEPIVTYWFGPPMTDAVAQQMADGGWNLVWCSSDDELDVAHRHGLRAMLYNPLFAPAALDDPAKREQLDALVKRVRNHPALYCYHVVDEPNAKDFPALGRLVAYLREQDPTHLAYINLFPTYARNDQLGTSGDTVTAYQEYLNQFVKIVQPALISYDHYQFTSTGDLPEYFLNLAMVRRASQDAGVPFLNIVQSCSWSEGRRIPGGDEMRYLVYTTLAYGGRGISYFVYLAAGDLAGAIAQPDGTPTELYHALKPLNRQFVAIAKEVEPLRSLAVYHTGMMPQGAEPLPEKAPFRLDPPQATVEYNPPERVRGIMLGYFGADDQPSHALVVNLDYKSEVVAPLVGPGAVETFEADSGAWTSAEGDSIQLSLPPGGGKLVRVRP